MKCPLIMAGWNATSGGDKAFYPDCLEKECAWWDDKFQQCLYITATEQLLRLANILSDIRDKMPHEEQFRR